MSAEINRSASSEKARRLEKAILLVEERGWDVQRALDKHHVQLSVASYPRIRRKYAQEGISGLFDRRGRRPKVTQEVRDFIKELKSSDPDVSAQDVADQIRTRFGFSVHRVHVAAIMRDLGVSTPGRSRPYKGTIRDCSIDHGGCFFLKAASLEMNIFNTIVDVIMESIAHIHKRRTGEEAGLKNLRIVNSSREVITKKIQALLFMPAFQMVRLLHFRNLYPRNGLGPLISSAAPYKYQTMDNFLRELPQLGIAGELTSRLAKRYMEVSILNLESVAGQTFYIDCFKKAVWTEKNIAKGMHGTRNKILKCLSVYFIHDYNGRPILPMTRPGDCHLVDVIFPVIKRLERAVGDLVRIAIFDREGLSLSIFQEFSKSGKRFITVLRANQYGSEADFVIEAGERWRTFEVDRKTGRPTHKIIEASKVLKSRNIKAEYRVRALLIKEIATGNLVVIVTNITRDEEPNGKGIAKRYWRRWGAQENPIKMMKLGLYLDTNHGLGMVAQKTNRVLARKRGKLRATINAKRKKIASAEKMLTETELQANTARTDFERRANHLDKSLVEVFALLESEDRRKKRVQLLTKQKRLQRQKEETTGRYHRKELRLQDKLSTGRERLARLESELKKAERKYERISEDEVLFDIDTRKDHIMTNLETALTNADIYVREHYLPRTYRNADFQTIRNLLYQQPADVRETKDEIRVTLNAYTQEPEHQRTVELACRKLNRRNIVTETGKTIRIYVSTP